MSNMNKNDFDITPESIHGQKEKLSAEIHVIEERIKQKSSELFAPPPMNTRSETIMSNINRGVAIFDGILFGLKLARRVRYLFKFKKRR
jgi:hypothetical protein